MADPTPRQLIRAVARASPSTAHSRTPRGSIQTTLKMSTNASNKRARLSIAKESPKTTVRVMITLPLVMDGVTVCFPFLFSLASPRKIDYFLTKMLLIPR